MKTFGKLGGALLMVALLVAFSAPAMADNFNPANYTLSGSNSNGYVITNAPSGFTLVGSDNNSNASGNTSYSTTFAYDGTLSFNYKATTSDWNLSFDPVSADLNGGYLVYADSGNSQSGSVSFSFSAGDVLTFNIYSVDNIFGSSYLTVSSYDEAAVPEPGSLLLLGTGLLGMGGAVRRKFKV